jgi:hypothetical protein
MTKLSSIKEICAFLKKFWQKFNTIYLRVLWGKYVIQYLIHNCWLGQEVQRVMVSIKESRDLTKLTLLIGSKKNNL